MMSPETIRALADEQAERAAKEKKQPYVPYDSEEIRQYGVSRPFPFPNIGSYRPKGWKLVEKLFCDKTGWGTEYEPAMTIRALRARVLSDCEESKTYGYAIVEEGQFQMYIGVFEKV